MKKEKAGQLINLGMLALSGFLASATAQVSPLLQTSWGQSDVWQEKMPRINGSATYPGCTTISTAQILFYYQHQNSAQSEVSYVLDDARVEGNDIADTRLTLDLTQYQYTWSDMALTDKDSENKLSYASDFIYHVGVSLNAQFGGDQGTSATGKQIENAFRYQWGFNNKSRRSMSIISKDAFLYSDQQWAQVIRAELDAGRPVLYNALQQNEDAGHSFVIDGYRGDGKVHVNWGWGGYANGYYDVNQLKDPSGRSWNRQAMIFIGLEPVLGRGAEIKQGRTVIEPLTWAGNGSLISKSTGDLTGYGITQDELFFPAHEAPVVSLVQWEVDEKDGTSVMLTAEGDPKLTIQYGKWNDRTQDRVYKNIQLPFILNPAADGYKNYDGEYFVIAVTDNEKRNQSQTVEINTTHNASADISSEVAEKLMIDGASWQGNASLISFTSAEKTGYGMTQDELFISDTLTKGVSFIQWEVDAKDGNRLQIEGVNQMATISYGVWNDRSQDISHRVQLPYILDPVKDGQTIKNGDYLVIKIILDNAVETGSTITAKIIH